MIVGAALGWLFGVAVAIITTAQLDPGTTGAFLIGFAGGGFGILLGAAVGALWEER